MFSICNTFHLLKHGHQDGFKIHLVCEKVIQYIGANILYLNMYLHIFWLLQFPLLLCFECDLNDIINYFNFSKNVSVFLLDKKIRSCYCMLHDNKLIDIHKYHKSTKTINIDEFIFDVLNPLISLAPFYASERRDC